MIVVPRVFTQLSNARVLVQERIHGVPVLNDYLEAKVRQQQTVRSLLSERHTEFNHRQLAVVERALSDPTAEFTVASHANTHHVTGVTARADLLTLAAAGILTRHKRGRAFFWRPAPHAHATLGVDTDVNSK